MAAVARDLVIFLNGRLQAGTLARDSLRKAFAIPAAEVDALDGLVPSAMRFLAGYGVYVCVSLLTGLCRGSRRFSGFVAYVPTAAGEPVGRRSV